MALPVLQVPVAPVLFAYFGDGGSGEGVGGALDLEDVVVFQLVYLGVGECFLPVVHEYAAATVYVSADLEHLPSVVVGLHLLDQAVHLDVDEVVDVQFQPVYLLVELHETVQVLHDLVVHSEEEKQLFGGMVVAIRDLVPHELDVELCLVFHEYALSEEVHVYAVLIDAL